MRCVSKERNHKVESMIKLLDKPPKRKPMSEYRSMKKPDLLRSIISLIGNYDRLRTISVDIRLENNFLTRRINQLNKENIMYKRKYKLD